MLNRRAAQGAFAVAMMLAVHPAVWADYPDKTVRIVVPFPAGGAADFFARLLGKELSEEWGTTVLVDNKPGAFGSIGTNAVATSAPDGYTIGLFPSTHAVNPILVKNLPYDTLRDFSAVTLVATVPGLLVINPSSIEATGLAEAIKLSKENPGKYTYASPGPLTAGQRSMELLKKEAGVDIRHIPYKGGPPAVADLLGGRVQFMAGAIPSLMPHVTSGRLRALAVTSSTRYDALPNIPTLAESGFPGFDSVEWYGLFLPAKAPDSVIAKISAAVTRAMGKAEVRKRMVDFGALPGSGGPAALDALLKAENAKWTALAPGIDLKAE